MVVSRGDGVAEGVLTPGDGVVLTLIFVCEHRAYEDHAGEVVKLLKDLGVPTMDRDLSGMTPQDLSPGIEF